MRDEQVGPRYESNICFCLKERRFRVYEEAPSFRPGPRANCFVFPIRKLEVYKVSSFHSRFRMLLRAP